MTFFREQLSINTVRSSVLSPDSERVREYRRAGWWPGESLAERFRSHVETDPTRPVLVDDAGTALSRSQLWQRAEALAEQLTTSGVSGRDVVVVYLPNTADWQIAFLACLQLGAVPATLPLSTDAQALEHVYNLTGARGIITCTASRSRQTISWAIDAAKSSGRAATVVCVDEPGQSADIAGNEAEPIVPEEIEHIMFTSSSTGMPKAVMHTADTLAAANMAIAERYDLSADTPIFMPSPLGHSVGAWHGARFSLFIGAKLVLQETWEPVRGLELIDEHACVFTAAATPFLKDIVDAPWPSDTPKMASMTTFICGGAPVPPVLLGQAEHQAPNTLVSVLWGMTEGTGTTCAPHGPHEKLTNSAGKPVPGLELTILDANESGVGELAMRGPQVFLGYLGQEELFNSLITEDGFFRTGDLAWIDDDGYLRLVGRLKDMIIRGGVNISPVPIEDAIAAHPNVRRVAVIGQSDDRLGERICAVIIPAGEAPTLDELNQWLTDYGLPVRKLPEILRVVDDMPITAAGKIRKIDLRDTLGASHA